MAASSAPQSSMPGSRERVEHEFDLLESAVALVASGGASRVIVVLRDHEPILSRARFTAGQRGVILRETQRAGGGWDIVVEPAA